MLCVCVFEGHEHPMTCVKRMSMLRHTCGSQETTFGSWSSSFVMWDVETALGLQVLTAGAFPCWAISPAQKQIWNASLRAASGVLWTKCHLRLTLPIHQESVALYCSILSRLSHQICETVFWCYWKSKGLSSDLRLTPSGTYYLVNQSELLWLLQTRLPLQVMIKVSDN